MIKNMFSKTAIILLPILALTFEACKNNGDTITALTGATPVATIKHIPGGLKLSVRGLVKKDYSFTTDSLKQFAQVRVRTREVARDGSYEGAYSYYGIPVLYLIEGIQPEKPESAPFDRPLDIIVSFKSKSGDVRHFSYGELSMTTDENPITLAYRREPVNPSKDPEKYTKNIHKENITGLRLICPGDSTTFRYLDEVTEIWFTTPDVAAFNLPVMKPGTTCSSKGLNCGAANKTVSAVTGGVKINKVSNWIRIGHGRGYKGVSTAEGYDLRDFLQKNFAGIKDNSFFMFVACDGYRSIFSSSEIFKTENGASMIISTKLDGKSPHGNYMLAPIRDYFVDRDVWGLTHIVHIDGSKVTLQQKETVK